MDAIMKHQLEMSLSRVEGAMSVVTAAVARLPAGEVGMLPEVATLRSELVSLKNDLKRLAELYEAMIAENAPLPLDLSKLKELQVELEPRFKELRRLCT